MEINMTNKLKLKVKNEFDKSILFKAHLIKFIKYLTFHAAIFVFLSDSDIEKTVQKGIG